tara:strand:- start:735 stop:947 length:213 start_codon:yes stop_codon:yes gene_type:complete
MSLAVYNITPASVSVTKAKNLQLTATIGSSTVNLTTGTHSAVFIQEGRASIAPARMIFTFEDQKNLVFYI